MSLETDTVRVLVCRLVAHQALPRTDELVRRLLVDTPFREAVDAALGQVGLELAENVYADFVSVRVARALETPVFEDGQGSYWSNNVGLSAGAMGLLTIVWSLLILPKRQRQQEQAGFIPHPNPLLTGTGELEVDPLPTGAREPNADSLPTEERGLKGDPLSAHPHDTQPASAAKREVVIAIERKALEADFGHLFSNQIRFRGYLNELKRRGFIRERRGSITEGPLLDVLIDYGTLAPRILEGALSRVLAARFVQPQMDADENR